MISNDMKKEFSSDPLVYPSLFTNLLNQRLVIPTSPLIKNRVTDQDQNQDSIPYQNPQSSPQHSPSHQQPTLIHSNTQSTPTHTLNTPTTPK